MTIIILSTFLFCHLSFCSRPSSLPLVSPFPLYLLVSLVCVKLSIELLRPMISKARSFNQTGSAKCKRSEAYISLGILNSGWPLVKKRSDASV